MLLIIDQIIAYSIRVEIEVTFFPTPLLSVEYRNINVRAWNMCKISLLFKQVVLVSNCVNICQTGKIILC